MRNIITGAVLGALLTVCVFRLYWIQDFIGGSSNAPTIKLPQVKEAVPVPETATAKQSVQQPQDSAEMQEVVVETVKTVEFCESFDEIVWEGRIPEELPLTRLESSSSDTIMQSVKVVLTDALRYLPEINIPNFKPKDIATVEAELVNKNENKRVILIRADKANTYCYLEKYIYKGADTHILKFAMKIKDSKLYVVTEIKGGGMTAIEIEPNGSCADIQGMLSIMFSRLERMEAFGK